ncbi:hypothetical protein [Streptomyces pseudovenezuelae]
MLTTPNKAVGQVDGVTIAPRHEHTRAVKWALAIRVFVLVLLGTFVAELFLFQVFDEEIRQEIAISNEHKAMDYRGMLISCNSVDGGTTTDRPGCGPYQLKLAGSPAPLTLQIKHTTARTEPLQARSTVSTRPSTTRQPSNSASAPRTTGSGGTASRTSPSSAIGPGRTRRRTAGPARLPCTRASSRA